VEDKLEKYMVMTSKALQKVRIAGNKKKAEDLLDIAKRYYADAEYFSKTNPLTALIAVTYSHAFLDCGARLGLFEVGKDSRLFMVD
jgi:hypothetical protein